MNTNILKFHIMKKLFLLIPAFLLSIAINATILDIAPNSPQASDNVRKEIKEELNADIIGEPKALGQVVADSGLCGTLVDVYLAEIAYYDLKDDYEGIHAIKEVSEEELNNMNINDSFTLAALTLLQKGQ